MKHHILFILVAVCLGYGQTQTVQCPAFPCTITITTTPPPVSVTPTSLSFSTALNTDSATQAVMVNNQGSGTVSLTSSIAGNQFLGGTGSCVATKITPGQCTIGVKYHPTVAGTATGTLTIVAGGTATTAVTLTGSTVSPPVLKPNLSWNASPTSGVTYNVYRSTTQGGPYTIVNTQPITILMYKDLSAAAATTYFYVARAFRASDGQESVNSNEVTITLP